MDMGFLFGVIKCSGISCEGYKKEKRKRKEKNNRKEGINGRLDPYQRVDV